jgi:Zn-dependent protease
VVVGPQPEPHSADKTLNSSIDVGETILSVIALVLSVAVHEFGHAWAASRMGDTLPKSQGRLTLNPIQHIDPIGTLLFPIIMLTAGGGMFGWGRPVMTNPSNYTRSLSRPTGSMLVSIAGPAMNLLMATLTSLIVVVGIRTGVMGDSLAEHLIRLLVQLNLLLMFFNLLPIPPLDGGSILAWVLPRSMQGVIDLLNRWGFLILLGLMVTGVLSWVMRPAYAAIHLWTSVLIGAAGAAGT